MSEKPHAVAIGAFVLGSALIALVTVLFLVGSGLGSKEKVVMVFDGSVKGLNVGAPLALRGVQVGQVTKIDAILDSDNMELIMLVEADFDSSAIRLQGRNEEDISEELLARGLRAQLNTQSLLTGLLYIQLDFHQDTELKLADIDSPYFQFPTIPTDLERITRKLQDIDISQVMEDMDRITKSITAMVDNEEFQNLPASLTDTLESLQELSERLQEQVASSGPRLDSVLNEASNALASTNEAIPDLSRLVQTNLDTLDKAVAAFEQTMNNVEGLVAPESATMYQLNKALEEMARAGRSLQSLAETLEEQPESLIKGKKGDRR